MPKLNRNKTKNRIVNWSGSESGPAVNKEADEIVHYGALDDTHECDGCCIERPPDFVAVHCIPRSSIVAYLRDQLPNYEWLRDFLPEGPSPVATPEQLEILNRLIYQFADEHWYFDLKGNHLVDAKSPYFTEPTEEEKTRWLKAREDGLTSLSAPKSVKKRRREELEENKMAKKRRREEAKFDAEIERVWSRWRDENMRQMRERAIEIRNERKTEETMNERCRKQKQIDRKVKRKWKRMAAREQLKQLTGSAEQDGLNQAEDAVIEEPIEAPMEEEVASAGTEVFPILALPNEVLSMIFRKLTVCELRPVALTCRKFHGIRLHSGANYFTKIIVDWTDVMRYISGELGDTKYKLIAIRSSISPGPTIDGVDDFKNCGIFKKPITDVLEIKFRLFNEELPPMRPRVRANPFILRLLKEVHLNNLKVTFGYDDTMHYNWLTRTVLYDIKEMQGIDLVFTWKGNTTHNVCNARKFLRNALYDDFDSLKLEWMLVDGKVPPTISEGQECLMDDDLLWFLACNGGRVELQCMGNYTVDGILRVFEMISTSDMHKTISFYAQKDVIDAIFAVNNYIGYEVRDQQGFVRYLIDRYNKTVLTASTNKIWINQERRSTTDPF